MEKTLDRLSTVPVTAALHYPESDGKPMGETDFHISALLHLLAALRQYFRQVEQLYVAGDMLLFYEEGVTSSFVVPDVFVVKGVAKHLRRSYKMWEERVAPCVVFEITSRSSRLDDLGTKRALYELLGVNEYFLFDPLDEYLTPRLQGFRLMAGYYQLMVASPDGTLYSQELGLILRTEDTLLRLVDPASGRALLTLDEAMEMAEAEAERAQVESERAQVESERAQVESERARVESERAQVESERAQVESERAQAESERARVESERAQAESERADRAESELARLRAELENLRRKAGDDTKNH